MKMHFLKGMACITVFENLTRTLESHESFECLGQPVEKLLLLSSKPLLTYKTLSMCVSTLECQIDAQSQISTQGRRFDFKK